MKITKKQWAIIAATFVLAAILLAACSSPAPGETEPESEYIHAVAKSEGVKNAIARAYSLTDVEWTPLKDVPGVAGTFVAGKTYKGIPYSGVTSNDCYVGLNVSLETFLTALKNENSALYTENLKSTNSKSATYFGTVCSKFVQFALNVPGSYNTENVPNIPGMETIAEVGKIDIDQIQLCDVFQSPGHTAFCTDILYDQDGNVAYIEIAEAVYPRCIRQLWSPEAFAKKFKAYQHCRYQYVDSVPAVPVTTVRESYALMPRLGDKFNYKQSNQKGIVDVLESGYDKAVIVRDGTIVEEILLNGATSFQFDRTVPGYLEMYLQKADGTKSGSVYACVVKSSAVVDDDARFQEGELSVTIDGSDGTPLYVQVGTAHAIFCNVQGVDGKVSVAFPVDKISTQHVRVAYENEYGVYLSDWVGFHMADNPSQDTLLSQAQYWQGYKITASNYQPTSQEKDDGCHTYIKVLAEENTTYYSKGAVRIWYLNEYGLPISAYEVVNDGDAAYRFTTPAGTGYISITYDSSLVEPGAEALVRENGE